MTEIRRGTLTEREFINIFGTAAQKRKYDEGKPLSGPQRTSIRENASRHCRYKENDNKTFTIYEIYEFPVPKVMGKLQEGLYAHIAPLILHKLLDLPDQTQSINLTVGRWARNIDMVNDNYSAGRNNEFAVSDKTHLPLKYVYDFYEHADEAISYYIKKTLEYLHKTTVLTYMETFNVVQEIGTNYKLDHTDNIDINLQYDVHTMTEEEFKIYRDCIKVADDFAGISNASERYYSNKQYVWSNCLHEELYKHGIRHVYKTFYVGLVHPERTKTILSYFGKATPKTLSDRLINDFSTLLMSNAEARYSKKQTDDYMMDEEDRNQYIEIFNKLCRINISRIDGKRNKPLGIESKSLLDDYNISINKEIVYGQSN